MKKDILQYIWMTVLFLVLIGLVIWGIWFVEKIENKISIFGIVAVITAAFTSVMTVSINNKKAKEREYDLLVLKENRKFMSISTIHFLNYLIELAKAIKGYPIKQFLK